MRPFLMFAAALTCAFSLLMGALRVGGQPAADDVRLFLGSGACAMPCWQGIRPGVTPRAQAEVILSTHPWLTLAEMSDEPEERLSRTFDMWRWNVAFPYPMTFGGQPNLFTDGTIGYLHREDGDLVGGLQLMTSLRVADLWRTLGPPQGLGDEYHLVEVAGRSYALVELRALGGEQVDVTAYVPCPITFRTLLESQASLQLSPLPPQGFEPASAGALRRWLHTWQGIVCTR